MLPDVMVACVKVDVDILSKWVALKRINKTKTTKNVNDGQQHSQNYKIIKNAKTDKMYLKYKKITIPQ